MFPHAELISIILVLIGLITPLALEHSSSGTFVLFATCCFLAYLWATYWVPETAGIGLEEMQAVFSTSGRNEDEVEREEAAMRRQVSPLSFIVHHDRVSDLF